MGGMSVELCSIETHKANYLESDFIVIVGDALNALNAPLTFIVLTQRAISRTMKSM